MKDRVIAEGWIAFALWTIATVATACLGTSLTWDGAYYLAATLEQGRAFVDHHRYANILLLEPALLIYETSGSVRAAAAIHGFLCGFTGIACFFGVLLLTRGNPRVRLWLIAGLVLSPLPGMIDATMEITPAMQAMFLAVAAAWFLPIMPGLLVAGLAGLWMCLMHPIAAPLLGFAACAVVLSDRRRWVFAGLFAVLAVARAVWVWLAATTYEKAQFDQNLAKIELDHMLASSPWWLVLAGAGLLLVVSTGKRSRGQEWLGWVVLGAVAGWWMSDPVRWSGALNYRKFAALFVLPFLIPAVFARRSPAESSHGSILGLTAMACVAWIAGAISWHGLMQQFQDEISRAPGPLVRQTDGVHSAKDTALAHWGATPLSLLLLGSDADRVYLGEGVSVQEGKLFLFPGQVEFRSKAAYSRSSSRR